MAEAVVSQFPLGVCAVSYNGADLGLTSLKGAVIKTKTKFTDTMAGKYGQVATGKFIDGQGIEADFELTQSQLSMLAACYPGVTKITGTSGASKLAFGLLAGTKLAQGALVLTPVLGSGATPDAQTGAYSPGFNITITQAVAIGEFTKTWNGSEYVWPVKFEGLIDTGKTNGRLLAAVGDDSLTADAVAPTLTTVLPAENATGVSDTLATIVWTFSKALNGNTVTAGAGGTVKLFKEPGGSETVVIIPLTLALVNNGASTTITATLGSALGAATKYIWALSGIQDQAQNALAETFGEFTTT